MRGLRARGRRQRRRRSGTRLGRGPALGHPRAPKRLAGDWRRVSSGRKPRSPQTYRGRPSCSSGELWSAARLVDAFGVQHRGGRGWGGRIPGARGRSAARAARPREGMRREDVAAAAPAAHRRLLFPGASAQASGASGRARKERRGLPHQPARRAGAPHPQPPMPRRRPHCSPPPASCEPRRASVAAWRTWAPDPARYPRPGLMTA